MIRRSPGVKLMIAPVNGGARISMPVCPKITAELSRFFQGIRATTLQSIKGIEISREPNQNVNEDTDTEKEEPARQLGRSV